MKLYPLWTDIFVWIFFIFGLFIVIHKRKSPLYRSVGKKIISQARYTVAFMIVITFVCLGLVDSIHYIPRGSINVQSVLDQILSPRNIQREKTYSAPFAWHSFSPDMGKLPSGKVEEIWPRLKYAGTNLGNNQENLSKNQENSSKNAENLSENQENLSNNAERLYQERNQDIIYRIILALITSSILTAILYALFKKNISKYFHHNVVLSFWITVFVLLSLLTIVSVLMFDYHIFGTDKVGRDVFYITLKSIRTGLVIGTVTTLVMLPFAIALGIWAGYFRGFVDDIIQYLYTTLGSVPGILLIAAAVVSFQVKIEEDPDLKLLTLCIILGATGWIGLCRLLRGETLKLRETEFVQASKVLGVRDFKIIFKHILPNLMHIVIITVVLEFSGLVLAETVLSYIGVGVSPSSFSWGNMINAARLEMAREPMVWWSLASAFIFMFTLVFSTNILGDAVQDALNPKQQQ